ncbi:G-type lectin S-receptor-like serine/threonine-protein kinase LECRK1 [Mangifera indica]|uniref:G-type lectin S-receptor-like serine/threonine-protein kinase LECRK1 n=1 Tax=Mangifera indica TaxID=29780 RepID=UPI001CF9ADFB|nr:G-type lectin S-receptor-like serine/threonine-protein kinase LECRK1 [Mangifera indica]
MQSGSSFVFSSKSIHYNRISFFNIKMQRLHFLLIHSIFLFFLFASSVVTAQRRQSNISLGTSLRPTTNSSWPSISKLYAFGFYPRGNGYAVGIFLAGIPEKTVVWTANRDDPPLPNNTTLLLSTEGKLVLQSAQGQGTDIANQNFVSASSASMLDSGNFVLYNSSGGIIWQSFDYPTDTILPTQRLLAGHELFPGVSETDPSTGKFRLKMQRDGNLVQYPTNTDDTAPYAYYASGTDGQGDNVTLNLGVDGHLYLLNTSGVNIKNIAEVYPTGGVLYLMRVDWDGIFRLYSHSLRPNGTWSAVWNSSQNKCDPKGLCGVNSYCVLNDQKPDCECLPGFALVNQSNQTSGCERDFIAESCSNGHGSVKFKIQSLENTLWEDVSYFDLSETTKEDCQQACLADCNCEAALFKSDDRTCRMQRLPLRFGRRDMGSGSKTFAFIKVGNASSDSNNVPGEEKKYLGTSLIITLSCVFGASIFVVLATCGIFIHRYQAWSYKRIPGNGNFRLCEDVSPISFTFAEIEKLTDGFKEEIGRGSSGIVYKGTMMHCNKFVAIKKLEKALVEGEREFLTEIKVIGRTHHKNLVRLLGYSFDGPNKVLVYEYMSNGSLADLLFTPEKQLNWIERMGIARDIARGILYLHDECQTQIIHCDIKPHNVLMDESRCAKIADFGLAKLLKPDQTNTFTGIRGTRGYVAPEWHRNLPITVKADIYSFGVVLLEIICCRRCMDQNFPDDQVVLEDWVYQCFDGGELRQLVGNEEVDLKQLERMVKVALWCILDEPSLRPSMKKVLLMLEGTVEIPIPPSPTSFLTCI